MTELLLPFAAAQAQSGGIAWDVAFGAGCMVLLSGGVTALVLRRIRPTQALRVVGVALGVAAIVALAAQLPSGFGRVLTTLTMAVGGIGMAVAVVTGPERRRR